MYARVAQALKEAQIPAVTMSGSVKAQKSLKDFNHEPTCRVMLLHAGSAAAGCAARRAPDHAGVVTLKHAARATAACAACT